MKEDRRIFLAYANFVCRSEMQSVCPEAEVIGSTSIRDCRLVFQGPKNYAEPNIITLKGFNTPAVAYMLTDEQEQIMDDIHIGQFQRSKCTTIPVSIDGEIYNGFTYRRYGIEQLEAPASDYYSIMQEGYREFDLDQDILFEALEMSVRNRGMEVRSK